MSRLFKIQIPFLTVVLCAAAIANDSVTWEKVHETGDGIVIFARSMAGSSIRELRATIVINAGPDIVWQAVMDRDTYRKSRKYIEVDTIFKTGNGTVWYNYQRVAPPMISKRDYTLRYESFTDPAKQSYRIEWRTANDHGPAPVRGVIRLDTCYGSFTLEPREKGGKTLITYLVRVDPGGQVPPWVANIANRMSIPDLLRDVRDQSGVYKEKRRLGGEDAGR